jgi:hypothetical protein
MARGSVFERAQRRRIERSFAQRAAEYGYDVMDLRRVNPVAITS